MNYLLGPSATKLLLAEQNKCIWAQMPKLPFIENFSWSWNVDFQFYKELCFRGRNKKTVTNVGLFQDLKIPPEISKFCQTHTHTLCMCVYYTHMHWGKIIVKSKVSGGSEILQIEFLFNSLFYLLLFAFPFDSTCVRPPIPKVWILTVTTLLL